MEFNRAGALRPSQHHNRDVEGPKTAYKKVDRLKHSLLIDGLIAMLYKYVFQTPINSTRGAVGPTELSRTNRFASGKQHGGRTGKTMAGWPMRRKTLAWPLTQLFVLIVFIATCATALRPECRGVGGPCDLHVTVKEDNDGRVLLDIDGIVTGKVLYIFQLPLSGGKGRGILFQVGSWSCWTMRPTQTKPPPI